MRHLGPWQCLAGITLLFAASSHATVYNINSTSDPFVEVVAVDNVDEAPNPQVWDKDTEFQVTTTPADGFCSVREAIYASNYRIAIDGCKAGTGNDTIKLKAGKTYLLTQGNLPIGIGEKITINLDENEDLESVDFDAISNQIAITLQLDAFEEAEDKVRPIISADNNSRVFAIAEGGALSLANVELIDGNAIADADTELSDLNAGVNDDNGGLIRAMGPVIIGRNVRLASGTAENGGAVYMTAGSGMAFRTGAFFEENVANQSGAVIATSDTFNGNIIGYDFYMANNQAGNAIIHVNGAPDAKLTLELGNGTITNNTGGVINVVTDNYQSVLANMTIAFNGGVALTLAETAFADPADAETTDHILHTVMVGNDGGACAGAGLDGTAVNAAAAARLLFTITDDMNCPVPDEQTLGTPVTSNPNAAQADVFFGEGRVECAVGSTGAGACSPLSAEEIGGPYPGFLPNPLPSAVDPESLSYVADDAASLFDRGNPENSPIDPCESTDNRGNARGGPGGRCDVGSIEFLRAQAQPVEINMISGQSVLGDVVANDLNDTEINCFFLEEVVVSEGICTAGDDVCIDQAVLDRCLTVVEPPELGSAVPVIDANGYPKIRYTPSSNFHGVDQIRYQVDKDAFDGGTDLGQNQNEIANFFAEPATGLTEKKSLGAQGGWMLMMVALAGMLRRFGGVLRGLVAAIMLATAGQAMAVDIEVNSLADDVPPIKNDGKCTLREALLNAAEAGSPDCAYGGDSTDTIFLPAGVIQLTDTLVVEGGGVEIVGKGARDEDDADDEETLTQIRGGGQSGGFRLFEVQPPNSSSGYPTVRFQFLTLEQGYASGNGTDGSGSGAVIISGGSVIFDRVRIVDNAAQASGGVAFIRSNAGNEKLVTFNRSFVRNNTAGVSGGVLSSTAQNGETFKLAMIDSTFANNSAVVEGGVLDANIRAGELQIANSTFVDNSAPKGSALDLSGLAINANIMNASFMNNTVGLGIDLGDADTETRMSNTAYFNSGDACTTGATILHESEYNAYSGLACTSATVSTTDQASTGASSLESTLSDPDFEGEGSRDDYVPPYLRIFDAPNEAILVNMGNDDDALVSGTGTPLACRASDLRGVDRTSGGRCDVGAFEYQQITAEDDEGNNDNTPARQVPVDILDNDLPSDGAEFVLLDGGNPAQFETGKFVFEHAELQVGSDPEKYVGTGHEYVQNHVDDRTLFTLSSAGNSMDGATIRFVWLYYNEDRTGYDLNCGDPIPQNIIDANPRLFDDGDVADECVVLFIPPATPEFDDRVCASTGEDPVKVAFRYTFTDSAGAEVQDADAGTVVMTIKDKPPAIKGRSVLNQPGQKVVFDIEIEDPDRLDGPIDWTRYDITLATKPSFAKRNNDGEVEGVGLIIEDRYDSERIPHFDPADANRRARVIYTPDSNFNTFKDVFTLKVQDMKCGGISQQAQFTIRYNNEETSAAAGSLGWVFLGGLLLLLRRRFAA